MKNIPDYLIVGSGLSGLAFGALMSQAGKSVVIIEPHEFFGGYGHTFAEGPYKFNAHLHYVVGCGEGGSVNVLLKKLGLENEITFSLLDKEGFDRSFCDGKQLKFPYGIENLEKNMRALCPEAEQAIKKFIGIMLDFRKAAAVFPNHISNILSILPELSSYAALFKYRNSTLQQVFDECKLPLMLQTLVAGQLLDYLAPPRELSFFIWLALLNSYLNGAYYPDKHFEHVILSLVQFIKKHGGQLLNNTIVTDFDLDGRTVTGVHVRDVDPKLGIIAGNSKRLLQAKNIICNMDPKKAAHMIGIDKFSPKVRKKLNYEYTDSSFVFYGVVKDIDLRDYGFGSWNIWHCPLDLNKAYDAMYHEGDYSQPYFVMNSCSLHTSNRDNCQEPGHQIFQMLTFANYDYWAGLKVRDRNTYNKEKKRVFEQMLDVVDAQYIPKVRDHIVFRMLGTPTTNERYVWAPRGGAYGVKLTPENFTFSRKLTSETSLKNFHFCCAASGVGGFCGALLTGLNLYEKLTSDVVERVHKDKALA